MYEENQGGSSGSGAGGHYYDPPLSGRRNQSHGTPLSNSHSADGE